MKNLTANEENILNFHMKENFRDVTNENVKEVVSIFEKLDPEVAMTLIDKMPEAIKGMAEICGFYADLQKKVTDSCESMTKSCYETEDKIVDTLAKEVGKDIPFEQKQYYIDKMENAVERKERKDTEHRLTMEKVIQYGGFALVAALSIVASIFLGGSSKTSNH